MHRIVWISSVQNPRFWHSVKPMPIVVKTRRIVQEGITVCLAMRGILVLTYTIVEIQMRHIVWMGRVPKYRHNGSTINSAPFIRGCFGTIRILFFIKKTPRNLGAEVYNKKKNYFVGLTIRLILRPSNLGWPSVLAISATSWAARFNTSAPKSW